MAESSSKNEDYNMAADDEEYRHFLRIVNAYKRYKICSLIKLARTEKYLCELPNRHRELLSEYKEHLNKVSDCIARNDMVIQQILQHAANMFDGSSVFEISDKDDNDIGPPTAQEIDKVTATIKQFVRDWSKEGEAERNACYMPIIHEILKEFPDDSLRPKNEVKILVPGAGLGRLAFEIANRGYYCQGNEFSLFMLLASNFVLNKCTGVNLFSIFPWVHQSINVLKAEDQVKEVWFPDINPSNIACQDGQFSMAAGDFLEIYKEPESWDCVATCFFIDCAHNIVEFVETIYRILKPGGIWINLGPLLYHFADMRGENSIEPSFDILKEIIVKFGFEYLRDNQKVQTSYTQNPASMMKYTYESVFFVCRKPVTSSEDATTTAS